MHIDKKSGCRPGLGCIAVALVPAVVVFVGVVLPNWFGLAGNEVAYLGAGILITFIFPVLFVGLALVVGVAWAPFAALICARVAHAKGLDVWRYALVGAIYSVLFLGPWIYLVARMHNKTLPNSVIRGAYVLLFGLVWPLSALSFIPLAIALPQPFGVGSLLLLLLSVVTWFISKKRLNSWHQLHSHMADEANTYIVPHHAYIMPFVYASMWIAIAIVFWWQANWPLYNG